MCRIAAHGNIDVAKALFARAATEEKALGYREPPAVSRTLTEIAGHGGILVPLDNLQEFL
jgi:hypothetical protein